MAIVDVDFLDIKTDVIQEARKLRKKYEDKKCFFDRMVKGSCYLESGNYQLSFDEFDRAVQKYPENIEATYWRGYSLFMISKSPDKERFKKEMLVESCGCVVKTLKKQPKNKFAWKTLSEIYFDLNQIDYYTICRNIHQKLEGNKKIVIERGSVKKVIEHAEKLLPNKIIQPRLPQYIEER